MANSNTPRDIWLKVLVGFIITILCVACTAGFSCLDKKVDKAVFRQYEKNQNQQYREIKAALLRIEEKM